MSLIRQPLLLLILIFAASGVALASDINSDDINPGDIDEGIDYRLVEHPQRVESAGDDASPGKQDEVEVVEFFWYGCPHCYHLEPELKEWLARQPEQVHFRRMPAANSARWVNHAKAFFAAEQIGALEQLHEPLFKALQEERRPLFSDEELIAFAAEQGVDEDAFRAAYESFPVDMQVRKSADLATRYGITGVPALVVNGAYVTSPTQTGSRARTFEVIDALIAREMQD
ncbi:MULTISPECIES: thiol:disulfide interchange protein DsbA/DsbL [Thiorhodovibrio]|uniref:thiol:disulfide interchange protein DsbA/DsbL n=1 Tax=Thiorhodovibrio TaxID=61593 RepID=UPI0019118BC7|nr:MULTISPECIES: thiol:disulfide interchange protein DsbA/DsbL [Thiorhodovibrio]MBK5970419.1 disulfide bond formation protein DsbA [Thiorhodovibrio winogradskyi]WPL11457.1 Thiol:disulfide interchange protein DsbA precursor [Thiorhodovibrio litoralis]